MTRRTLLTTAFGSGIALGPALAALPAAAQGTTDPWITYPGGRGPGRGKHIVLLAADQEYRSEETMPQLARILSTRHGFRCTVLFCIDPADGTINPLVNNIPGLEALKGADLLLLFARFLDLPDAQMRPILEYVEGGKPVVALRTSTHAFNLTSPTYKRYTWNSTEPGWEGGFGRRVLGETWVAHHGEHGKQGTRGVPAPGQEDHPILRGIQPGSLFGTTDVYTVRLPLPGDSTPVVLGQVTETLEPGSAPVPAKNDPMMPVAWTRHFTGTSGRRARVFTTTMGASQDLAYEGTRRMILNGVYWALGMDPPRRTGADADLVGEYRPTPFRFKKKEEWKPGVRPADLR